jgi:16S rRNA (guanine966-N2)-methyltransferase
VEFKGEEIRPTSDKVRESLFNILQNRVYGCRFLDLFCGTGAMGIEALSRGANHVTFNDASRKSLEILNKNLQKVKVQTGYKVSNCDAERFVATCKEPFDIIYIDPPYKSGLGIKALNSILPAVSSGGIIVYEEEQPFEGEIKGLKVVDTRKYGRVHLTFFNKEEE